MVVAVLRVRAKRPQKKIGVRRAFCLKTGKSLPKSVYCGRSVRALNKAQLLLKERRIVGCGRTPLVTLIRPAYLFRGEFGLKRRKHKIKTEDSEMKRLILSSAIILALGAGSVLMAQNANTKKAKPAATKKAAKNSNTAAAAPAGGTMKASGKKHHRKHRKHAKKS
jgi:hypothetical protein